ncbi:MAG TPA: DUF222 domain-containing protein [Candidatus Dormibacteraeota bacterium]|nr:DUF222 domain-containing protein [Candidatus Dormibacteraeota bacterium]
MFARIEGVMMGEGGLSAIGQDRVTELTDRLLDDLFAGLDPDDVESRLVLRRQVIDRIELDFSIDAAAFARDEALQAGPEPVTGWFRHECNMQFGTAVDRVNVGEQLAKLPESAAAVAMGEIGFAHLSVMARLVRDIDDAVLKNCFIEGDLLDKVKTFTPGRLWHYCVRLRHALNAEGVAAEQRISAEERWLRLAPMEDGSLSISGRLDSVGGAAFRAALEPLARPTGKEDDRCLQRRNADAAVELATLALDGGRLPHVASQRPHLQVTTTLETLCEQPGSPGAEMEFALPISSKTVQRIACDASVARVVFGPGSVVVDAGRARRVVTGATRRALNARDHLRQWPGCERTASQSSAHHLIHWIKGGATDLSNLILLCHRHHWMVHEGGWQLVRAKDERLFAVPPPWDFRYRTRAPDEVAAA